MVTVLLVAPVLPVATDSIWSLGGACSGVRVRVAWTVTLPSAVMVVPLPMDTATVGSTTELASVAPTWTAPPP